MSSKWLDTIQDLRDVVIGGEDVGRRQDETRRIKFKKKTAGKKDIPSAGRNGKSKRFSRDNNRVTAKKESRVRRPLTKQAFNAWMVDVGEAVDQFIGMDLNVLPTMPWKRWYKEGFSAVVAAKNAVQMYEDLEDDEDEFEEWSEDEDDEEEDLDEEEDEEEEDNGRSSEDLNELFGLGQVPYHKWYKRLAGIVGRAGMPLVKIQEKLGIKNTTLHSWYNAGYSPAQVVDLMLQGSKKKIKATVEDMEQITTGRAGGELTQSLGGWVSALGMKSTSPAFVDDSRDEEEKFAEEEDSGDNEGAVGKNKDAGLFGIDITELAERAQHVVNAKPHQFKSSDPTKVHENPTEILNHDRMFGDDDIKGGVPEEEQEVGDGK